MRCGFRPILANGVFQQPQAFTLTTAITYGHLGADDQSLTRALWTSYFHPQGAAASRRVSASNGAAYQSVQVGLRQPWMLT